ASEYCTTVRFWNPRSVTRVCDDFSLPEVCIASNTKNIEEEMNYEVQQAYRIFNEFLTDKHKVITSLFLQPIRNQETQYGIGGVCSKSQANVKQSICLRRMEERFINKEYETITEFVADFRLMLENCYRYHGVDHWLSKQAQKLEIMLEQKLTLLSRKLREKTTLAVTSKGRFAVGEECISTSSTRRRQTSRCLKTLTVGESIMVQTLRVEEQHKAKEEKRRRELEKKEAEEMSAKETDEWEKNLLSQASPHNVETLWELPAIGHFLCLAQTALNLPEIVYFELERCLLMPRCSFLLSKIMSSLLSPPQKRSTLHRRPVMPYKRWESELRQWVKFWYQSVGASIDQASQAEQLGLCHQFFSVLGEISPLEAKAFHMLPFYQRVWLLKGLCDHVYQTQRDIQNALLAQPIHECRESILGYDSKENAYIHFPHFCGADLRIYCQSPCTPPSITLASVLVKKVEKFHKLEDTVSKTNNVSGTSFDDKSQKTKKYIKSKVETIDGEEVFGRCHSCKSRKKIPLKSNDEVYRDESRVDSVKEKTLTMKIGQGKKKGKQLLWIKHKHKRLRRRPSQPEAPKPVSNRFILVCTNLDDLRELINKTEDELDDLESAKKKLNQRYYRREAVKDLHSTLIRLLNELMPWEPKLIKAYQRNRLRLKKEFDVFRNHPEYCNFVREESISSSDDGDLGLLLEQFRQSGHEDPEHIHPRGLGGNQLSLFTSYCKWKTEKLHPIPTLLVKNIGNKVTLMKQPAHPLEIDNLNLERKRTVVSIESTDRLKVNASSSGPPKNSQQNLKNNSEQSPKQPVMDGVALPLPVVSISKTAESLKESTQVFYTGHTSQNPSVNILNSKIDTMLGMSTNLSGFSIPENKIHVQQVPPSKNIGLTDTSLSLSDIPSFPKSQQSAINAARSNGTQHWDVQTGTSQCTPNYSAITSTSSSHLLSTDSKQELKTVCIRESQSILVTTRGGNTGIVKVQKSSDHPCLSKSPVITVSPQFQAHVVPKTSPLLSSGSTLAVTTGPVQSCIQSLKSNTKVTTCAKTTSISFSQDMSQSLSPTKCQFGYSSTNPTKEVDQMMPITAQPAFTNSRVISRGFTVPASSLNSLKHLNISSVSKISQPGKPCTHPLSAASFKKKHSLSTIMISSKSNVHPSQSFSKPLSTPSTQSEPLNSLFISNASAGFDKTSLPLSLAFTKSQVSNTVPKSTEITEGHKGLSAQTPTNTSTTGTVQEQILISTSMPLPGGAHIVLNNAHFMVPPNELGPGSHVLTIASNVPEQLPATSVREVTVPFLDVNQATVLQSVTRLPSVPAVRSSFVACAPIVAPSLQTTAVHGSKSTSLINKTVEGCPSLQSANIESTTEGLHNLHPSNNRQC
uniref:Bromo domain-containing protein n=1 Tax=Neogobius melanostomus TaxID=47308 RepID=A0A8C6SHR0_9GOBI